MQFVKSKIFGHAILVLSALKHEDERGYFEEVFNKITFNKKLDIEFDIKQENHSFSQKGVLRGLHAQANPHEQAKIISVKNGLIHDVVVDIRKGSKTFGMYESFLLSGDDNKQLYISEGFAHGFLTYSEEADIYYKVNSMYNPESEFTIKYNDPEINIDWKGEVLSISEKDKRGISLSEYIQRYQ